VYCLDAIRESGRRTGWHQSRAHQAGREVRDRVEETERWLRHRTLTEVERRPVTGSTIARIRSGRNRRRYSSALDVARVYQSLLRRIDRPAIREAIQERALVTREDDVLLELLCAFRIEKALQDLGWKISRPGLVRSGRLIRARKATEIIDVYYQHAPNELAKGSIYGEVQQAHAFSGVGLLRPDLVLRYSANGHVRWLLIEVKGVQRSVEKSARQALLDLLAYRQAFSPVIDQQPGTYGLGIAWGADVQPATGCDIALCSPDTILTAIASVLPPN
jgi:hypothetical protein